MRLMEHRAGENGLLPFRTTRIFNIGPEWFFAVRDGKDCGPFESKQNAASGLKQYLSLLTTSEA